MTQDDRDYFARRAAEERAYSEAAKSERAASIHRALAELYEERAADNVLPFWRSSARG